MMTGQDDYCSSVLKIDDSIRFAGKIVGRRLVSYARRGNKTPYLDENMANMAHYQVSVRQMMNDMFDGKLGKTNWIVASREMVNLITIFQKDGILILSTEPTGDHVKIIKKIQKIS